MSYLLAGFCAIWLVLFFYMFSVSRRQRALTREVEALRQKMEQQGTSASP